MLQTDKATANRTEPDKIKKQTSNFEAESASRQAAYEKYWKPDILNDLYKQIKAEDYARAEACLTYKRSLMGKEYNTWFNSYIEWVKHLHELDEYFDNGNSHVVNKTIDGRRITMVSDGNIHFEEKGGAVKSRNWYEFSSQGLYELLQKAKPELAGKRKEFDADIAYIKGNIFSPEVIEGRPFLKELCMAVVDGTVESILIMAVYDKNQAATGAENLLNMLKNTEFLAVAKARLGTLGN